MPSQQSLTLLKMNVLQAQMSHWRIKGCISATYRSELIDISFALTRMHTDRELIHNFDSCIEAMKRT
jgi:hypothetical protein